MVYVTLKGDESSGVDQRLAIYGYISYVQIKEKLKVKYFNCWWYEGLNDDIKNNHLEEFHKEVVEFMTKVPTYMMIYPPKIVVPKLELSGDDEIEMFTSKELSDFLLGIISLIELALSNNKDISILGD